MIIIAKLAVIGSWTHVGVGSLCHKFYHRLINRVEKNGGIADLTSLVGCRNFIFTAVAKKGVGGHENDPF